MSTPTHIPELTRSPVVIVGGASGVGLAMAEAFASAGVRRIGLIGRNRERGETARAALAHSTPGLEVIFARGDANDCGQAKAAVDEINAALGGLSFRASRRRRHRPL
jgi:2-hydroxycyclohexanecarboxyl-CoA dehydrogenase